MFHRREKARRQEMSNRYWSTETKQWIYPNDDPYEFWPVGEMTIGRVILDDAVIMDRASYEVLRDKALKYDAMD